MRRLSPKRFLILLPVAITLLAAAPAAWSATIDVTMTADRYDPAGSGCSLREAVTAAQTDAPFAGCPAGAGADTIRLGDGTYRITRVGAGEDLNATGDLDVTGADPLTIQPATADARVVVDGNGLDRVFHQGGTASLSLVDLTVTGGRLVTIDDGGGILNGGGAGLSLDRVTVNGNHAHISGGGIAVYNAVSMVNSTVSGNSSDGSGGGLYVPGGATATARSSTITGNVADSDADGNGDGGGFAEAGASAVNFHNVINAGNQDLSPVPADQSPDCLSGPAFLPRYTLSTQPMGTGTCLTGVDPGTNQVVADPELGPLADNGGGTFTHALMPGSLAIDAGGSAAPDTCPPTDQRGTARPAGGCDIGSFELVEEGPLPLPPIPAPTGTTATFDGKRLFIRLKCPARFKPKCRSRAVPVTRKRKGAPMAKARRVVIRSNRFKRVTFLIKPRFRAKVAQMTYVDRKRLITRQSIRSNRIRAKRNRKRSTVFHVYKVRVRQA